MGSTSMCRRATDCEVPHYQNSSTPLITCLPYLNTPLNTFSLTTTVYENVFRDATLWVWLQTTLLPPSSEYVFMEAGGSSKILVISSLASRGIVFLSFANYLGRRRN